MTAARTLVVDLNAQGKMWRLPPDGAARLRASAPDGWTVVVVRSATVSDGDGGAPPSDEVLGAIGAAEAYFGFGLSPELFAAAPALRWVHTAAAGVGSMLFPALRASDVIITNSAGVHAVPIAETTLAGVLFLLRGLDIARAQQRERRWTREPFLREASPVRELRDCRALIVGAGGIGRAIAQRLSALGTTCIGVRRRPALGAPPGFSSVVGPDAWRALLPDTELLILAAPSTAETRQLVTASELDRLPRGAIVVNVARGALLDEAALAERVRGGGLRGAVLDVFAREPLSAESPLWDLSSVVLTPHVSAVSPRGFWTRELQLFLDNWRAYVDGRPMANIVDKSAGY